jgi:signal peptidase II
MYSGSSGNQRFRLVLLPLFIIFGIDQLTKVLARIYLKDASYSFWHGLAKFKLLSNPGIFLGLGSNLSSSTRLVLFSALPLFAAVAGVVYLLRCKMPSIFILIWSTCCACIISNVVGRIFSNGSVTDFMILSIGPLHTGVFNFADFADLPGITFMIFLFWKARRKPCVKCGHITTKPNPRTLRQQFSGNFTCPNCGCEFNMYGVIRAA